MGGPPSGNHQETFSGLSEILLRNPQDRLPRRTFWAIHGQLMGPCVTYITTITIFYVSSYLSRPQPLVLRFFWRSKKGPLHRQPKNDRNLICKCNGEEAQDKGGSTHIIHLVTVRKV